VERADGRPDLTVPLLPEAAAVREYRELADEPLAGDERGVGARVGVVEEDTHLVAGAAVIQAVERQVGPGQPGPVVTGRKLDLEGDGHCKSSSDLGPGREGRVGVVQRGDVDG